MAWILKVTRNLSLMKLRENKKETELPQEDWIPQEESLSEKSINKIVMNAALEVLSQEERQIVVLHSVSGLRHREIAGIMEIPLSTTLSKYRRALVKLKKYLKEEV